MGDQRAAQAKGLTIRRALAPSTISLPSVVLQRSSASEHKANRDPTTGATAILNRVASNPSTPKGLTPRAANPPSTPSKAAVTSGKSPPVSVAYTSEKCSNEVHVAGNQQGHEDGYISFPDFDRFRKTSDADSLTDVKG